MTAIHLPVKRVQLVLERCRDAEVAATAADRPEEIGIHLGAGFQQLSVGGDDVHRRELIAGQPEAARQAPESTAQRQATGARMGDRAGRGDEAEGQGLAIEIAEERPAPGACQSTRRIHAYGAHRRQVDHEAVVTARLSRQAVGASAHGDEQVVRTRKANGPHDVGGSSAAGDERRAFVKNGVEDLARVVVTGRIRQVQLTPQARAEVLHIGGAQHELLAVAGDSGDVVGDCRNRSECAPEWKCRGADRAGGGDTESPSFHGPSLLVAVAVLYSPCR